MNNLIRSGIVALVIFAAGCSAPTEALKTLWGSSTRALEEARSNAIVKVYDKGYWEVVRSSTDVCVKKGYIIFEKNEVKGYLVVMGIKGSVNTTEAGIFFVELNDHQTRIEISSLSTNAKRTVAKNLFQGLDIAFGYVSPDSQPASTDDQTQDIQK